MWRFSPDPNNGTHVAGIIAAEGNNGIGVTGVCWSVELVSLKVALSTGYATNQKIMAAIEYAKQTSIPILNISMGGGGFDQALQECIENYNGLVICAAGNDHQNTDTNPFYPSCLDCENIISVGACTNDGSDASFSNYGEESVDIFAPGCNILSCYPIADCNEGVCDPDLHFADGYHYMSGTSMAAPFVTGVAALLLSNDPYLYPSQIKDRILEYAEVLDDLEGKCSTGGRLNAYLALHDHAMTYVNTNHNSHHDCVCSICNYTIQETHTFSSGLSLGDVAIQAVPLYRCTKCGYTTSQIGINSAVTFMYQKRKLFV